MVDDKELEKIIRNKKADGELTKEQKEENIISWTTFYRRNLDCFNEFY